MADHPSPPPNARLLALTSPSDAVPASVTDAISFPDLDIRLSPFYETTELVIDLDLASDFPLGFDVATCSTLHRAFISSLLSFTSATLTLSFLHSVRWPILPLPSHSFSPPNAKLTSLGSHHPRCIFGALTFDISMPCARPIYLPCLSLVS
jgi:hypothetical protein